MPAPRPETVRPICTCLPTLTYSNITTLPVASTVPQSMPSGAFTKPGSTVEVQPSASLYNRAIELSVTGSIRPRRRPSTHVCCAAGESSDQIRSGCPLAFCVGFEKTVTVRLPSVAEKVPSSLCASNVASPAVLNPPSCGSHWF